MLVKCEVNGRVTEENNVVSVSDKQNFIDLLDLDLSEFEKQFDLIESEPVKDHSQILFSLYEQIDEVDFRNEAGFLNDDQKLLQKHFLVTCVEKILETADKNNWGVCRNHNFIYLYNGCLLYTSHHKGTEADKLENHSCQAFSDAFYYHRSQRYRS